MFGFPCAGPRTSTIYFARKETMPDLECIGCGVVRSWSGQGLLCLTCGCGATVFITDGGLSLPASLGIGLARSSTLAHLDYYLGASLHITPYKREFIQMLRSRGAVWPWECEECRPKRCPFRWQCPRWKNPFDPDNKAVVAEVCTGIRHEDCPSFREWRAEVESWTTP